MADIEKARKEINECDREMARLFEKRMAAVREVARYKQERGLPVEDLAREGEVIAKNSEYIENDVLREFYVNFLQTGMDISKNYQRRLISGQKIAYSGVPGAFADLAARKIFPDGTTVPCADFKAAYDAVVNGECDCALLPIENSYNGDVGQVMDLAYFGPLYINGVYQAEIVQNLLAVKGTTLDEVKSVISHPQALGQCSGYIRKHGFESIEAVNTAVAAKTVADKGDHSLAAIGSARAAQLCGLKILESHINESGKNTTRFAVFFPRTESRKQKRQQLYNDVYRKEPAGMPGQGGFGNR